MSVLDPKTTHRELTEHRFYPYRGCAPDPDDPRVAAGNTALAVTSWDPPDVDGCEEPRARRTREAAAVEVCVGCPVMVQCLAYGSSVTAGGKKLVEPHAVLGGMTALERHRAFVKTRHQEPVAPAPDRHLKTPQKLAVLRALAAHTDPYRVAEAAGMDVRTANWQRSILAGKLGLGRGATRRELLAAASRRGLLGGVAVVADDGTVPAVPPPTRMPAESEAVPAPEPPSVVALFPVPVAAHRLPARGCSPRRGHRFTAVAGQLSLDDAARAALVTSFPVRSVLLEAA